MFWSLLQYAGLITSFLYLWLEFKQRPLMWIVSALCSAIYATVYCHAQIYGDMGFSLFNICMCAYGFWKWMKSNKDRTEKAVANASQEAIRYRHFRPKEALVTAVVGTLIWGVLYLLLRFALDSPVPALDACTTMLNIVGTWVLAQKIIEVWGFWFLVNLLSIYLYAKRGLHLTTILLYTFYLGASVYGYLKWKRKGTLMSQA